LTGPILRQRTAALACPRQQLVAAVLAAAAVNLDETGWHTTGEARTLWTATTPQGAIFRVAEDRHRDRPQELIAKDYDGIACSDRWWAYDYLDLAAGRVSWQHLYRDFRRRALSASITCRLQVRSPFAYLAELLKAHARGDPLPTLA
jgi:hypothetical protein